jgi:hypothetical protein
MLEIIVKTIANESQLLTTGFSSVLKPMNKLVLQFLQVRTQVKVPVMVSSKVVVVNSLLLSK